MARSKSKKASNTAGKLENVSPPLNPLRAGMPALDSITGVDEGPKGQGEAAKGKTVYRVIHTNEVDEYEKPLKAKGKKH